MHHTLNRTNSLSKILQVVRKVIGYYDKGKGVVTNSNDKMTKPMERRAHLMLVRTAQRECFGNILRLMEKGLTFEEVITRLQESNASIVHLKKLVRFIDNDGILRVGGRLDYAEDLAEEARHPAIQPTDHRITKLFILDRHERLTHRAAEWVLASSNTDVGVRPVGGVRTVRLCLHDCFVCKLLRKSRAEQLMAPLPNYRVRPREPVVSSITIDYAGPYEVKRGRSTEKNGHAFLFATSPLQFELKW